MTLPTNVFNPLKASISNCFELKSCFKMKDDGEEGRVRVVDDLKFRRVFEELAKTIPAGKGKLIVIGFNGDDSKIIDLVSSGGNLRKEFKEGLLNKEGVEASRYKWYKALLYSKAYEKLKIQLVS